MDTLEMDFPTVTVRDGAGFSLLVDATAPDPISTSLRRRDSWAKRWLKRLLRWPVPTHVPHFELLRQHLKPGDRVLDLGAHIGLVSLAAARLGCEVLAVEACPRNAALLRASARLNGFERLHVVHAAIGEHTGTLAFSPHGPFGHVHCAATDLPRIEVPAVRGDDLLAEFRWERVDFIKLDVEGSEIRALRGLAGLLRQPDAPPILVEANAYTLRFYAATPGDLLAELTRYGYSLPADSAPNDGSVRDLLAVKSPLASPIDMIAPSSPPSLQEPCSK